MEKNQTIRLFVDLDGTAAEWMAASSVEELYQRGYFANLMPHENVVQAVQMLTTSGLVDTFVLSAFLPDSKYALKEKRDWVRRHMPEIVHRQCIFIPCGVEKVTAAPGGIRPTDILLDDYTVNLASWSEHAVGVKLLNGINGTKGTWKGRCISGTSSPQEIFVYISNLALSLRGGLGREKAASEGVV